MSNPSWLRLGRTRATPIHWPAAPARRVWTRLVTAGWLLVVGLVVGCQTSRLATRTDRAELQRPSVLPAHATSPAPETKGPTTKPHDEDGAAGQAALTTAEVEARPAGKSKTSSLWPGLLPYLSKPKRLPLPRTDVMGLHDGQEKEDASESGWEDF